MYPFESQGAGYSLTTDLAHFANHPEDHRWQRPVGAGMVMFARTVFERWTPEGGYIHRNGSIAFMVMDSPARQSFNLLLPQAQQHGGLPNTTPEGCPGSPGRLIGQPNGFQCREDCAPLGKQSAADQHPQEL